MPFLGSIFKCSSKDNDNNELFEALEKRVTHLEYNHDALKDILLEIKLDIKLINMNINNLLNKIHD